MGKNLNIGDYFFLVGSTMYGGNLDDIGRIQVVIDIRGDMICSEFLDDRRINKFQIDSPYYEMCEVNSDINEFKYGNGIPIIWEGDI